MMKAKSYGDYDSHKKVHDEFVAQISGLSAPVSGDTVHFAKDWSAFIYYVHYNTLFL